MPTHTVEVTCPIHESFRTDQVRGMFDLAAAKTAGERFDVELPDANEPWQIGVVVGPSGSGKSTVAREAYGAQFCERFEWPRAAAVIDGFDQSRSIKEVTALLTSVGFSSPPSWVKPYHVLSGGERFRCDLARALLEGGDLVAFDEFTSVVDRTVAKIGSAAVAKAIRKGRIAKKFVAVTCHYDVIDWLEPDWILDMATQQLARGHLRRRPTITLEVAPVHRSAWLLFRRHHYLNTAIATGAKCFVAFWTQPDGTSEPVAFSAWLQSITRGWRGGDMREHRTVVLPDYQGVGIGNRLSEFCAGIFRGLGRRAYSTTSHPAMIGYRSASPKWNRKRLGRVAKFGSSGIISKRKRNGERIASSHGRITGGFEYVGPGLPRDEAAAFLAAHPRQFALSPLDERILAELARTSGTNVSHLARRCAPTERVRAGLDRLTLDAVVERFRVGRGVAFRIADPHGPF